MHARSPRPPHCGALDFRLDLVLAFRPELGETACVTALCVVALAALAHLAFSLLVAVRQVLGGQLSGRAAVQRLAKVPVCQRTQVLS